MIGISTFAKRSAGLVCLSLAQFCAAAHAQAPSWADPELLKAAKAEGTLTVYSSVNEQEGLPFWKVFEDATGIKVEYVRGNDVVLISRISIERRGNARSWDVLLSPAVTRLPPEFLQ